MRTIMRHWPTILGLVVGWSTRHSLLREVYVKGYESSALISLFSFLVLLSCIALGVIYEMTKKKQRCSTYAPPLPQSQTQTEHNEIPKPTPRRRRSVEEIWAEIDSLTGLGSVKDTLRQIEAEIRLDKERRKQGLSPMKSTLHMVFSGNPGTGKTTIARLTGELLAALGALPKGQLVEVDRSGLVAEYIGHTAQKTLTQIKKAMGGVLFIDEAYSLARGSDDRDFGREALDTLVKAMEDNRDNLCVILAGYTDETQKLFEANPGLESRIAHTLEFPDYSPEELLDIARLEAWRRDWQFAPGVEEKLLEIFQREQYQIGSLGNGRFARKIVEKAIGNAATRLASDKGEINVLLEEDFSDL